MTRGELVAWSTGVGIDQAESGDRAGHELTAYLTGAARAEMGGGLVAFLNRSRADVELMLVGDALAAFRGMPRDVWAHWVRAGYLAAQANRPGQVAGSIEDRYRGVVTGVIESGAAARAGTRELWDELKPRLADEGLLGDNGRNVLGRRGWEIVNEIRSRAVARRNGYTRFQRAAPEQIFDARMAAPEENIRSATERALMPQFLARFDLTFINPAGDTETKTVSVKDVWHPGMTVGDVYDVVTEAAEGLSLEYGQAMIGFANIRPVMI